MPTSTFPASLYNLLDVELYVVLGIMCLGTFLFYKSFLKRASNARHQSIQNHLKTINRQFFVLTFLFVVYLLLREQIDASVLVKKLTPYIATMTYIAGVVLFVRVCRLNVLMYLFLGSMTVGVPLLLVNIFSLILFVSISIWSVSHLFNVQVAPLLATSAALSVILGLALQDTLGNLFAGISLQIDKAFELGDWLEIQNGSNKIVGQVKELTWRATVLVGWSDEIITLPNKVMASSQVSNYSPAGTPIVRRQVFRISHTQNAYAAKDLLERAVSQIADIRAIPSPMAYISDVSEHWIELKVVYFIDSYGRQYLVGDKVYSFCLDILTQNGFKLAHQIFEMKKTDEVKA
ncbi:mechanosensitive ion channel family protein [Pseudobdellovibrio sp. HCB154]|uniref:mechanosensitive ion channel family protein n=1 Tax=Pseudobdellovibrio sp. HCB154 TaxID=3386277 RepID=UPI00391719EC